MKERMTKGRKEIKSQYKSTIEWKKEKKYLKESKIEWKKEEKRIEKYNENKARACLRSAATFL